MPEIDLKEERRVLWYASDGLKVKCGHCDATVETALLNVAGVTDADADHETQTVQVECADTVTAEQLAAAVEAAGEKFHALSVTAA